MDAVTAIIQARMGSTRLPGKVLLPFLDEMSVLEVIVYRLRKATCVGKVVIATSDSRLDDPIEECASQLGISCIRGDEEDVMARFAKAIDENQGQHFVRITADCPLVDPSLVDQIVKEHIAQGNDYTSNVMRRSFPDGLDVEVFTREAFEVAHTECVSPVLREHVTPYLRTGTTAQYETGQFKVGHVTSAQDYSHYRWTLDDEEDYGFFRALGNSISKDSGWLDIICEISRRPSLTAWNMSQVRSGELTPENRDKKSFQQSSVMLAKALDAIPLGSQTFSKSYLGWPVGAAPLFSERSKGARVWDVDGNEYVDFIMGLLPVVLGHADPDVNAAIIEQLLKGVSQSMPTALEEEVASLICSYVPSAEQVRFAKNGSDATSAAIRLARAATGRDHVVALGYHGWHDWYAGLTPRNSGVPHPVKDLTTSLPFNDLARLEDYLKRDGKQCACVILEPDGKLQPDDGYLQGVRALCDQFGVVLVFDEIITGFRIALGGAQSVYGVVPDLTCLGKSIANGMPLSAITGRRELMSYMEQVFLSGTFGGEAASLAAAKATLGKLDRVKGPERMAMAGQKFKAIFNVAVNDAKLSDSLQLVGPDWWPRINFSQDTQDDKDWMYLCRQEFASAGLLIAAGLNLSVAHDSFEVYRDFEVRLKGALLRLSTYRKSENVGQFLRGKVAGSDFDVRGHMKAISS